MAVIPPASACLRCVFPEPPSPAELPTCDTAGVLAPTAAIVASLQVAAAMRVLLRSAQSAPEPLITADAWQGRFKTIRLDQAKRADCITCGGHLFQFLDAPPEGQMTSLCGRNAVQVRPHSTAPMELSRIAQKLSRSGLVQRTPYLVRCELADPRGVHLTVFPDGRAIVNGTADLDRARSIYSRFIGD
jgi:adenylyltransferase/sulfurtransferase